MGQRHSRQLVELITERNFQKIAEVGVYQGKNYVHILRCCKNIKDYWAIDPWLAYNDPSFAMGRLTQEQWDQIYLRCCQDMYWFPCLHVVREKSENVAKVFPKPYFDFIYLDAQHEADAVESDINAWKDLVLEGGAIGGHDFGKGWTKGHRVAEGVLRIFKREYVHNRADGVWWVNKEDF
jgi:hypothetical protein